MPIVPSVVRCRMVGRSTLAKEPRTDVPVICPGIEILVEMQVCLAFDAF